MNPCHISIHPFSAYVNTKIAQTVSATFEQEGITIPQGFFGSAGYRTLLAQLKPHIKAVIQVGCQKKLYKIIKV